MISFFSIGVIRSGVVSRSGMAISSIPGYWLVRLSPSWGSMCGVRIDTICS